MSIGKKLYAGFGLVLAILSVLFVVNIITGFKERSARTDATLALDSVRTVEAVRYQIMLNRLNMNNFLLSGDPRDEDKVEPGSPREQRRLTVAISSSRSKGLKRKASMCGSVSGVSAVTVALIARIGKRGCRSLSWLVAIYHDGLA